jgi:hypothetical protein
MIDEVLRALEYRDGSEQARVILYCLEHEGSASREKVYELAKRDPKQVLRGFTRPVKRVVKQLMNSGVIPVDAPMMLEAHYELGSGRAAGFRVPEEWREAWRSVE